MNNKFDELTKNNNLLFIDIETVPNLEMLVYIPEPEAPSNYKDPQKIADYIAGAKEKTIDGMALDQDFARIVAIGTGEGFDNSQVVISRDDESERKNLTFLWEQIANVSKLAGFNLIGFDLPIILRRSWVLGVKPTKLLEIKKYGKGIIDLMNLLYHGAIPPKGRGLKGIAKMYGIKNPLATLDGSMVKDMSDEILARYCLNDIRMTQELAEKTQGYYWE